MWYAFCSSLQGTYLFQGDKCCLQIFLYREGRKGKTNGSLLFCSQRFMQKRRTVKSRTRSDAIVLPEHVTDYGRLGTGEIDGKDRNPGAGEIAIDHQSGNPPQPLQKLGAQISLLLLNLLPVVPYISHTGPQTGDSGYVGRPCFQNGRNTAGLVVVEGMDAIATRQDRPDRGIRRMQTPPVPPGP